MSSLLSTEARRPPALPGHAHKGLVGRVLCIAGRAEMPGAAVLCLRGAQRAGAGLCTLVCIDSGLLAVVPSAVLEAVYLDLGAARELMTGSLPQRLEGRADHARVIGPGLGRDGKSTSLVRACLVQEDHTPLVLDADGLAVGEGSPEKLRRVRGPLIITPHPGEAARLLGREIPASDTGRSEAAREIAERTDSICVLKGPRTVIATADRHRFNTTGNPGLATAGAGDVLAGVLGAYVAWSVCAKDPEWDLFEAVCAAAHVHGLAGDLAAEELGRRAVIASDLLDFIPRAQREFGCD